jgi:hypothetical protein
MMGSASIRRIAFVAALLLLAPIWCRPSAVAEALDAPGLAMVGLTPAGTGTVPAIRRQATGAWWTAASRPDHGRSIAAVGLMALFALLGLTAWAPVVAVSTAPASLGRRRHVISLRAPPPACAV